MASRRRLSSQPGGGILAALSENTVQPETPNSPPKNVIISRDAFLALEESDHSELSSVASPSSSLSSEEEDRSIVDEQDSSDDEEEEGEEESEQEASVESSIAPSDLEDEGEYSEDDEVQSEDDVYNPGEETDTDDDDELEVDENEESTVGKPKESTPKPKRIVSVVETPTVHTDTNVDDYDEEDDEDVVAEIVSDDDLNHDEEMVVATVLPFDSPNCKGTESETEEWIEEERNVECELVVNADETSDVHPVNDLSIKSTNNSSQASLHCKTGQNRTRHHTNGPAKLADSSDGSPIKTTLRITKVPSKHKTKNVGIVKRGKWTVGPKIGSGAFGIVYVGMNTANGTLMAVKSIQMERAVMKDVRREMDLLQSLKHSNIVRYYGAEMDKSHLHIFQEWVPGGSVTELLNKFGPFSLAVIRSYISQTLQGLAYLHDNGILHRDIKGSNILVNDDGIVKLADFGASKRFSQLQADMMMSLTMRGTPYFMAPEVFEEKYSSKADIWSIGCVMAQMATGSPPWKNLGFSNPVSLFNHIKSQDGPPPISISPAGESDDEWSSFEAVLARCFQRIAKDRPSAHDLSRNQFFSDSHAHSDDEQSDGHLLFSPGSVCSWEMMKSPIRMSPVPQRRARSNSIGPSRSPFMSPPLPKHTKASPLPLSPQPDTSEWPTWARSKHESDKKRVDSVTDMMGSLALSEDSVPSTGICQEEAKKLTNSVFENKSFRSPLHGLQFLDQTASRAMERNTRSPHKSSTANARR